MTKSFWSAWSADSVRPASGSCPSPTSNSACPLQPTRLLSPLDSSGHHRSPTRRQPRRARSYLGETRFSQSNKRARLSARLRPRPRQGPRLRVLRSSRPQGRVNHLRRPQMIATSHRLPSCRPWICKLRTELEAQKALSAQSRRIRAGSIVISGCRPDLRRLPLPRARTR